MRLSFTYCFSVPNPPLYPCFVRLRMGTLQTTCLFCHLISCSIPTIKSTDCKAEGIIRDLVLLEFFVSWLVGFCSMSNVQQSYIDLTIGSEVFRSYYFFSPRCLAISLYEIPHCSFQSSVWTQTCIQSMVQQFKSYKYVTERQEPCLFFSTCSLMHSQSKTE